MLFSWLKNSVLAGGILLPAFASAQIDVDTIGVPVKNIDAVWIPASIVVYSVPPLNKLTKEDIETLNTDDVAGLLSKVPGATIKSYGGLGGLKTTSMRGLGGQHSAVMIDGFLVTNAQAGQLNLGQLQSEGLVSVEAGTIPGFHNLMPVSSNFAGNYLHFTTFMKYRTYNMTRAKASVRYGSFERREVYAQADKSGEKWHGAVFAKYRDAAGSYPFQVLNGQTTVEGLRGNNDYRDAHFGAKFGRQIKDNQYLNFFYRSSWIDQGLPGAVILYNESADERMTTMDHRLMVEVENRRYPAPYRFYLNAGINQLEYYDPTYLNSEGFIRDQFQNVSLNGGYIQNKEIQKLYLKWGAEQKVEKLSGNRESLGTPLRSSTFALIGAQKQFEKVTLEGISGVQLVVDQNNNADHLHFQFTPNATLLYRLPFKREATLEFNYKRNFRLPSFNELYFGEVGNSNLQPEIAHQFQLEHLRKIKEYGRWYWDAFAQIFYNRVRNKIVAIPTKNLFVWSMQNVDEAMIYGGIAESRIVRRFNGDNKIEFRANYTWQRVIDITPNAITYGHQVAYAPEHTANADLMYLYKGFSMRVSNNFVSGRYALNQNVPANHLDPFWTLDASVGYQHALAKQHKIGVQFDVRNITNTSYAFIRSYVMPGRHYLLTLNYEIH